MLLSAAKISTESAEVFVISQLILESLLISACKLMCQAVTALYQHLHTKYIFDILLYND